MQMALLLVASIVAVVAFAVPVRTKDFGYCGLAGPWVTGLFGDPTGPTDPDFVYAEYNACRHAARPALVVMLSALAMAAVAGGLLLRDRRNRRPQSTAAWPG
jgi:hypothetical protein